MEVTVATFTRRGNLVVFAHAGLVLQEQSTCGNATNRTGPTVGYYYMYYTVVLLVVLYVHV